MSSPSVRTRFLQPELKRVGASRIPTQAPRGLAETYHFLVRHPTQTSAQLFEFVGDSIAIDIAGLPAEAGNSLYQLLTHLYGVNSRRPIFPFSRLSLHTDRSQYFLHFRGVQKVRVPEEGVEPTRGVIPGRF